MVVSDGDYVGKRSGYSQKWIPIQATLELPARGRVNNFLKQKVGDAVPVGSVVCLIDTSCFPNPEGGCQK